MAARTWSPTSRASAATSRSRSVTSRPLAETTSARRKRASARSCGVVAAATCARASVSASTSAVGSADRASSSGFGDSNRSDPHRSVSPTESINASPSSQRRIASSTRPTSPSRPAVSNTSRTFPVVNCGTTCKARSTSSTAVSRSPVTMSGSTRSRAREWALSGSSSGDWTSTPMLSISGASAVSHPRFPRCARGNRARCHRASAVTVAARSPDAADLWIA